MKIRDRIVELRRVKASDLRPNPRNWRTHPQAQQDALRGVLAEVGIADALLARELPDGSLMLVDGHLRADTDPGTEWPVLILDVNEAEADKLLATFDPLAAMAEADSVKLDALLREVDTGSEALQKMLAELAEASGVIPSGVESKDPGAELDKAEELQKAWGTKRGQVWQIGRHRAGCGDSTDAAFVREVRGVLHVDGVCTDPPYELTAGLVRDCLEIVADAAIVMCGDKLAFELARFWKMRLDFIWHHRKPKKLPNNNLPIMYHVHCLTLTRTDAVKTGWKKPHPGYGSVIKCEHEYEDNEFGQGKHAEVFEAMLAGFPWKVVADPFLGSGGTLIACENMGLTLVGVELDPIHLAVALERAKRAGLAPCLAESSANVSCAEAPAADCSSRRGGTSGGRA